MTGESRRIRFVLGSMALLLALNLIGSYNELGWKASTVNVSVVFLLDVAYILRYRDVHLGRWLLLGLTAGSVELLTDWWLVRTGTLVYPPHEPMIWASPAYMPVAWTVVLVQIGAVGSWLQQRQGMLRATLLSALISGINIPLYEHLAKDANYWFYQYTPMVLSTPYYIICAEFLLALPLVWLGLLAQRSQPFWSLGLGVLEGVWMFPVVVFAFWLLGPCSGAALQWPCP